MRELHGSEAIRGIKIFRYKKGEKNGTYNKHGYVYRTIGNI